MIGDPRKQYLHYYYYMTVYNNRSDRGQNIGIYITDNQTSNPVLIDRVSIQNMTTNGWQNGNVTFNSSADNYTVKFFFLYIQKNT